MKRRLCRSLAIVLAFTALGTGGCYGGYGGHSGYGGYTRGGGYTGSSCHYRGSFTGDFDDFLLFAGIYGGIVIIAGAAELIDRCIDYCSD